MAAICLVDDKQVPLYRILWVSAVPHFCGSEECQREGQYEVRMDQGDAVWANQAQRDAVLEALKAWGEPEHRDDDFRD